MFYTVVLFRQKCKNRNGLNGPFSLYLGLFHLLHLNLEQMYFCIAWMLFSKISFFNGKAVVLQFTMKQILLTKITTQPELLQVITTYPPHHKVITYINIFHVGYMSLIKACDQTLIMQFPLLLMGFKSFYSLCSKSNNG